MRAMRSSGVDWLGEIPVDWDVKRVAALFKERKQQVSSSDYTALSVTKQGVVPQLDSAAKSDATETRKLVREGDFVINSRSDRKGSSGLAPTDGSCSSIYIVLEPKGLEGVFAHQLFRSHAFQEEFYRWGTGIVDDLWSTRYASMKMISIPVPPKAELDSITAYLDKETSQIDLLISKKEQLIDKLLERRQALITQAVTKGLDPNLPMKDSGVEWIGAMPRDFELDKASRFFKARKGSSAALLSVEYCAAHPGQYPVYSGQTENGGVMAEIDTFEFDFHEKPVLFTTTVGSSKVMSVDLLSGRFSLSQNCMILVPTSEDKLLTRYAFWMLQALFLEKKKELSAHMQLSFRMSDFYGYRLIVPPAETQREVASYLETETKKIEQITSAAISAITLLKERRQALVTQVVTGKLDVRGFAGGNS